MNSIVRTFFFIIVKQSISILYIAFLIACNEHEKKEERRKKNAVVERTAVLPSSIRVTELRTRPRYVRRTEPRRYNIHISCVCARVRACVCVSLRAYLYVHMYLHSYVKYIDACVRSLTRIPLKRIFTT